MFFARDTTGRLVSAKTIAGLVPDFQAAHAGQERELCCPDPGCTARVHFVRDALCEGGRYNRKAHFATNPGQGHQPGCLVDASERLYARHQDRDFALRAIISLNIPALQSHRKPDKNARPTGPALCLSVKSTADYMSARARLIAIGMPREHIFVRYKGHYLPLHKFELSTPGDRDALYAGLKVKQGKTHPPSPVCSTLVPRLLLLSGPVEAAVSTGGKPYLHDRGIQSRDWSAVTSEISSAAGAPIVWSDIAAQYLQTLPSLAVMAFPYIRREGRNIVWPVPNISCLALPVADEGPAPRFTTPLANIPPPAPLALSKRPEAQPFPDLFAG